MVERTEKTQWLDIHCGWPGQRTESLRHFDEASSASDLANKINDAVFLQPMRIFFLACLKISSKYMRDLNAPTRTVCGLVQRRLKLPSLNSTKVSGPHGIPAWLLRENSDFLTEPVKDNLSCSFKESCIPPYWKSAEVVPVPKEKPVKDVNKHVRPISLTRNHGWRVHCGGTRQTSRGGEDRWKSVWDYPQVIN